MILTLVQSTCKEGIFNRATDFNVLDHQRSNHSGLERALYEDLVHGLGGRSRLTIFRSFSSSGRAHTQPRTERSRT